MPRKSDPIQAETWQKVFVKISSELWHFSSDCIAEDCFRSMETSQASSMMRYGGKTHVQANKKINKKRSKIQFGVLNRSAYNISCAASVAGVVLQSNLHPSRLEILRSNVDQLFQIQEKAVKPRVKSRGKSKSYIQIGTSYNQKSKFHVKANKKERLSRLIRRQGSN
jgi:hypothetical protein